VVGEAGWGLGGGRGGQGGSSGMGGSVAASRKAGKLRAATAWRRRKAALQPPAPAAGSHWVGGRGGAAPRHQLLRPRLARLAAEARELAGRGAATGAASAAVDVRLGGARVIVVALEGRKPGCAEGEGVHTAERAKFIRHTGPQVALPQPTGNTCEGAASSSASSSPPPFPPPPPRALNLYLAQVTAPPSRGRAAGGRRRHPPPRGPPPRCPPTRPH
jgi:hypothetical protein